MIWRLIGVAWLAALAPAQAWAQQNPDFWLRNESGRTIAEVYVWPDGATGWGEDRLGQYLLADGMQFALRPPRGGCLVDVRIVFADGAVQERRRINACQIAALTVAAPGGRAQAAPTPAPVPAPPPGQAQGQAQAPQAAPRQPARVAPVGPNASFRLVNRSGRVITEVFVSPAEMTTWGRDRLGRDEVLGPGQSMAVNLPRDGTCVYDVRVVYADGSAAERRRVNTCAITEMVFQ